MLTDKGVSTYIWHVTCIYTCVLCTSPIVYLVQDVHCDNVYFVLQSYPATLLLPQWLHHESCREASSTRREEVLSYCFVYFYDLLIDLYKMGKTWLCGNAFWFWLFLPCVVHVFGTLQLAKACPTMAYILLVIPCLPWVYAEYTK